MCLIVSHFGTNICIDIAACIVDVAGTMVSKFGNNSALIVGVTCTGTMIIISNAVCIVVDDAGR